MLNWGLILFFSPSIPLEDRPHTSKHSNTIYFLKSNEDLLEKISNCHLQAAGTIVGLFVWEDRRAKISDRYLCNSFIVSLMVVLEDSIKESKF